MPDIFTPVVTEAGFNAALAAETGGFSVDVTHVAVGSSGYAVATNQVGRATQLGLVAEEQRVAIQDARDIGNGQTDISFVIDGPGSYYIREIGFFLADGTLFAVASDPVTALMWKSDVSRAAIALELVFEAVNSSAIQIVAAGPDLTLLMTREIATVSAIAMRNALENLRLADRIRTITGEY
ncbi:phage-related tail fiber protein [Rubricella aquisinus]|uniref:Phage-related tail fiber protein n=1 Tax=Rubricella aquisinus TaxID=2028108 RepID=A0A840WNU9_9RHOB|nr:phage tail protein [Rubricella aquisinus]MBB5515763.1 phage-related tail fiber protein [Rubricella aquisinus]